MGNNCYIHFFQKHCIVSPGCVAGLAVVPSAATGQLLGGFVAHRMKLGIPGLIKLCILGMVLTLLSVAIVWIDCGQEDFVGVTSPYPSRYVMSCHVLKILIQVIQRLA